MIDFIQQGDTTHNYTAVNVNAGAQSIDSDFGTYAGFSGSDSASGSGGSFAGGGTMISEHVFSVARTIKQVIFRPYGNVSSNSSTDNAARCDYAIQYQLEGSSTWVTFTSGSGSAGSGSSGGSNSGNMDPGTLTLNQTVQNVKKIRVTVSNGGSFHNDNGSHSWDLRIYEVQAYGDISGYAAII